MKNLFISIKKHLALALLLLFCVCGQAQNGPKMAKAASKDLAWYLKNPTNNKVGLAKAKQKIGKALKTTKAQATASAWLTKGEIYAAIFYSEDLEQIKLNPDAPFHGDDNLLEAYNGYSKALELATQQNEKIDALKGLKRIEGALFNMSTIKYKDKEYDKAFEYGIAAIYCYDNFKANGQISVIPDDEMENLFYSAGYCAKSAKMYPEAIRVFEEMQKRGYESADIYRSMIDCKIEMGDAAGARAILVEGRKKYPDNTTLLFMEINYGNKENRLDEQFIGLLKKAIEKEPDSVDLYFNLGSVYCDLQRREIAAGNMAEAQTYFDLAKENYTIAAQKAPERLNVHYQLGLIFYNKAQLVNGEMIKMGNTSKDAKKFELHDKEVLDLLDQALSHFQKVEALDANDLNTLTALAEIYTRKEDALAEEFQKRLNRVKNGGKNTASYFK